MMLNVELNETMTNITLLKRYNSYTNCLQNLSTTETPEEAQQRIQYELNAVYDQYYGHLALPLASIALFMTITFIASIWRAIRTHRVSRKSYVLILNRSIGDLCACTCAIINGIYVISVDDVNRDFVQIVDTFYAASYYAAMVSYVSLSLLKLYAVARPFDYRKNVNMKRCIHIMICSWIIFVFMAIFTLSFIAMVKIDSLREFSGCKSETCMRYMFRIRNIFTVFMYLLTIVTFLLTVVFINRARKFVSSFHRRDKDGDKKVLRHRFPLWKLAVNIGTFAVLHSPYALWGAGTLFLLKDPCYWARNAPKMMTIYGCVRVALLIRITIDPIISFITDYQVRRSILSLLHLSRKVAPLSSRRKTYQKTGSEENSSEQSPVDEQAMRSKMSVRTTCEDLSSRKPSQE